MITISVTFLSVCMYELQHQSLVLNKYKKTLTEWTLIQSRKNTSLLASLNVRKEWRKAAVLNAVLRTIYHLTALFQFHTSEFRLDHWIEAASLMSISLINSKPDLHILIRLDSPTHSAYFAHLARPAHSVHPALLISQKASSETKLCSETVSEGSLKLCVNW